MNSYPKFIQIEDKKYPINTDFRIALECDKIFRDQDIGDYEKILAIIYKLFGEEALEDVDRHQELLDLAIKYLRCGKSDEELVNDEEPSMDFKQDKSYISASFMSDYQIDLSTEKMHWWKFCELLQGLTPDTILNRVRYIREEPLKDKKGDELQQWLKMKKAVALKKVKTKEEKELDKIFEEKMKKKEG